MSSFDAIGQLEPPFYLVDLDRLRPRHAAIHEAFLSRFDRVVIGYSYKTNYLPCSLRTLHAQGAWSEVVSELEFALALRLGVPGSQIVYNGPIKSDESIARALGLGSLLHLDSLEEASRVAEQVRALGLEEWIVLRDAAVIMYAMYLAPGLGEILYAVVVGAALYTDRDVQVVFLVKRQAPARRHIGDDGVVLRTGIPDLFLVYPLPVANAATHNAVKTPGWKPAVGTALGVVQINPAILSVIGMQRDIQQPAVAPDENQFDGVVENLGGAGNEV